MHGRTAPFGLYSRGVGPTPVGGGGLDEATRTHIRNLDVYVARLTEELSVGRDEIIQQLRSEIKLLARIVAASGDARES